MDLIVHGETESNGNFRVATRTLSVSGHGGMMVLEPEVTVGQKLLLINVNSGQKAECTVMAAKVLREGGRNVAFEFTSETINFWRMSFPVPGAKPLRRSMQVMFGSVPSQR